MKFLGISFGFNKGNGGAQTTAALPAPAECSASGVAASFQRAVYGVTCRTLSYPAVVAGDAVYYRALATTTTLDQWCIQKITERAVQLAGTAMSRTVDGLFASRAVSLSNVVTLSETLQIYTDMYLKFQEHLTSSVPEWEGLIAHGNLMVDRMELQMVVSAADKKGIELHEKSEQLHEMSRNMHKKSMEQGTYDLTRIAQSTERLVSRIKSDMLAIEDQSRKQQAARERLDNATLGLAETFHRSVQKDAQMVLGHSNKSAMSLEFQSGAQGPAVQVPTNDNQAETVEAKAAEKPARKRAAKPAAKPE